MIGTTIEFPLFSIDSQRSAVMITYNFICSSATNGMAMTMYATGARAGVVDVFRPLSLGYTYPHVHI